MSTKHSIALTINGQRYSGDVEARLTLADFLRHHCDLTGTHVGCEHGVCGACTIHVDGRAARSCTMYAVQADGSEIKTVEGLASDEGNSLHPVQEAFREFNGLQCGFCTPGMQMTIAAYLEENPNPSEQEIRELISGNICRCTGYQGIVKAGLRAAERLREEQS
ncbi:MAG: (2Fe-2S)-binding protein [Burkholderiaceae bacterium]